MTKKGKLCSIHMKERKKESELKTHKYYFLSYWYVCFGVCLEVLEGDRSYLYILDQRRVLLYPPLSGESPPLRVHQLGEGRTRSNEGGRRRQPSQPDRLNQPWHQWGDRLQRDRPHIQVCVLWKESF